MVLIMKKTILFSVLALSLLISCKNSDSSSTIVTFETTQGNFKVEFFMDKTPLTTQNFIDLVKKGFYDGTAFHRVIPQFMVQGGDPLTKDNTQKGRWGTGGPGYEIEDEFDPSLHNVRGTIAMANHGPNTGGSQFFINVVDNTHLNNKHTVFGKVVGGMDVVDAISQVATDGSDRPLEEVVVRKITVK